MHVRCEFETDPCEYVATDQHGSVVRLTCQGWEATDDVVTPPDGFDSDSRECVGGRTARIDGPAVVSHVHGSDASHVLAADDDAVTVAPPVRIDLDAAIRVELWVPAARVRIDPSANDGVQIAVTGDDSARVGLAFRPRPPTDAPDRIETPPDAAGVALALSACHATIEASGPTRTWPSVREPVAPIAVGATQLSIPESLVGASQSSVTLRCPPDPAALLPLAPLAVYLGCGIDVRDGPVAIDAGGRTWTTPPPEPYAGADTQGQRAYESWVHDHLQRVFYLDCLVREAGDHANPHRQSGLLAAHGLDQARLYASDAATRLGAYEAVDHETICEEFPEWHLSVSVSSDWGCVSDLAGVLHRLPLVRVADGNELSETELTLRVLEADTRGASPEPTIVEPGDEPPGRYHAWANTGVPFGGWELRSADGVSTADSVDTLELTVIVADSGMVAELETAAMAYDERESELGLDVQVYNGGTADLVADALSGDADLVHYIGHCEDGRLQCWDTTLDVGGVEETGVSAVFLNACGTVGWARHLVDLGVDAAVATTMDVGEPTAASVGQDWARLLARGWPIASGLERARSYVPGGGEYTVIGDGTTILTQTDARLPPSIALTPADGDGVFVERVENHPLRHGMQLRGSFESVWTLAGDRRQLRLSHDELTTLLDRLDSPVEIDGELLWPSEQARIVDRLT